MRHVAHFRPTAGVIGKLQLLRALLFAREWRSHCLVVRLVQSLTPCPREQTLYRKMELALQGYPHIVRGPHE